MSTILIIDDEPEVRTMLRAGLEAAGYEIREVGDGAEGIKSHRTTPADLILCDLIMPGKEGLETIKELRGEFPSLKIIAMSGGSSTGHDFLPAAKLMGADRTIVKPFRIEALVQLIGAILA